MSGDGVVYEVALDLDAGIRDEYLAWLRDHVGDILALDGFLRAEIEEVIDPPPGAGRAALCVRYTLRDADSLHAYFENHAPRMRAEGVARFGERFSARRRVLRPLPRD